jgi:eukaryotic-like serine/threonine-protein kinase
MACCHAALAAAGREGLSASTGNGESEADKAIALLRRAVLNGYRGAVAFATEAALDPLRERSDFRLLMMDLAMPADPFARVQAR